ncbi:MAG: XRE family transcriptional regulator [Agathobacter sp.]|nr:XRE family transcriptional regulator [Agathobacter sp.]
MDKKSELIGDTLKKYRKHIGLSVPQVAVLLEERYDMHVAAKTIYGWESSQCLPPAQKLLALCDIYQINNINSAFIPTVDNKNFVITPFEKRLVEEFRNHPDLQVAVCRILGLEKDNV